MVSVILLEDDMLLSMVQKKMLQSIGYDVIATSTSGEEGLKKIEELKPDIVVSDQNLLGNLKGLDIVIHLREQNNNTPFIILSGDTTNAHIQSTKNITNLESLSKPVNVNELKTKLKSIESTIL